MEKIKTFRRGRVWLNVFKTPEGGLALTVRKSYPAEDKWKSTHYFRPRYKDVQNLQSVLKDFLAAQEDLESYGEEKQ